jgi:hypothetical protein
MRKFVRVKGSVTISCCRVGTNGTRIPLTSASCRSAPALTPSRHCPHFSSIELTARPSPKELRLKRHRQPVEMLGEPASNLTCAMLACNGPRRGGEQRLDQGLQMRVAEVTRGCWLWRAYQLRWNFAIATTARWQFETGGLKVRFMSGNGGTYTRRPCLIVRRPARLSGATREVRYMSKSLWIASAGRRIGIGDACLAAGK